METNKKKQLNYKFVYVIANSFKFNLTMDLINYIFDHTAKRNCSCGTQLLAITNQIKSQAFKQKDLDLADQS